MRSKSLPAYLSLVLGFGVGALAQAEMAECLPGWEWVRRSHFLAYFFRILGPERARDIFLVDAKARTKNSGMTSYHVAS